MPEYNEKPKTLIAAMKKSMAKPGKMKNVRRVARILKIKLPRRLTA